MYLTSDTGDGGGGGGRNKKLKQIKKGPNLSLYIQGTGCVWFNFCPKLLV